MSRKSSGGLVELFTVGFFVLAAALPVGCSQQGASALMQAEEVNSAPIFITGHDPDFHAQGDAGARNLLSKAVAYVRHGSSLPFLWVESDDPPPPGYLVGRYSLPAIGLVPNRDFIHLNGAQLAAQPASWWNSLATTYSAIAVASDFGGILTQVELDQLNAHRDAITQFVNAGGGVLALSEGGIGPHGLRLTTHDQFHFLPINVDSTGNAAPPYTVTSFGQSEFGLVDADVNDPSHSHFNSDFGLNVVSRSVPTGQIMTLAGKVRITAGGFLVSNAGPDQTLDATGALTSVTLDGSGSSTDPGGRPLHYTWEEGTTVLIDTSLPVVSVNLPPGVHNITLVVTNSRGETANDQVVITIRNTLPTITCPANIVTSTEPEVCSAHVSYPAPTASAPDGVASVTCDHASGSVFPGGVTPVVCTVTDQQGRTASCGFTITVKDTEPPVLIAPPPTVVSADGMCLAGIPNAVAGARASDNCTPEQDLVLTQTPAAGTPVSLGTHVITLKATDAAGNSTTATTTETVRDTTPPTISGAAPSPSTLWPPNHQMVAVDVAVAVSDNCDHAVQCQITSITSNEPVNGVGDGNTAPDWAITGALSTELRAERAGPLSGRIYTLDLRCTDFSGNSASGSTSVSVVHDQRGN